MSRSGRRPSLLAPDVERYLLVDEGEEIVDEVLKHGVTAAIPVTEVLVGVTVMLISSVLDWWWWTAFSVGLIVALVGLVQYHARFMDRFVVTNMRVFRVHGIFTRHVATVPLSRILDISVRQPFWGMVFNYGHFVFESAAAEQGLREISYVGDPRRRDLTIQRVIQRAGIRAMAQADDDEEAESDGT